ncbi:hypothetical protein LCGC14_2985900 [marine sediment metagenome]|uniref:Uncharacterized protein n=1 Tax=marine sediment metagenome TaxID=412755 RepID=A0A0F8XSV3_9ZZZZ
MLRREEFDVLEELRKTGPLPPELEQRYEKLRRQQLFAAGLDASQYPPPSSSRLENVDVSIVDWLQKRWISGSASVRHSLLLLADKLSIPLPMTRTRPIPPKDSSPARRTKPARQPYVEQDTSDSLPGLDPEFRRDPPEWHEDHADGWEPCESLYDALHPPKDRHWY